MKRPSCLSATAQTQGQICWRLVLGRFEIRPGQRELLIDGQPAAIGARAFDVLLALLERRDRTVPKSELLDVVWAG
jgi:DNA-binding winged helix-turn-helix (wHTH) protein